MQEHCLQVPVVQFLENVGSSPPSVVQEYSRLTTGTPVIINADMWGWVGRNRLYWIAGDGRKLSGKTCSQIALPDGFELKELAETGKFKVTRKCISHGQA